MLASCPASSVNQITPASGKKNRDSVSPHSALAKFADFALAPNLRRERKEPEPSGGHWQCSLWGEPTVKNSGADDGYAMRSGR